MAANKGFMISRKKIAICSVAVVLRLFRIVLFSCLMSQSSYSWATSLLSNVPEAADYELVYEFDIPVNSLGWNAVAVPYLTNNTADFPSGSFPRTAYYVEATTASATQWVYVSMNSFTNDATKIGVPTTTSGEFYHYGITGPITNANIYANVVGITTGTVINTVNIEFWPSNYGSGNDYGVPGGVATNYDFGDGGAGTSSGHATMQIHNYGASNVLFAYNAWGTARGSEFGLGTQAIDNPDWTFNTANISTYTKRTIQVLVSALPRTYTATNVMQTSMALNGRIGRTNGLTYAWMFWGPADGGTNKSSWANSTIVPGGVQARGEVSATISSLTPQTTYYHRLYVSNTAWQAWAPISKSVATLNSFTWDGDVDDLWWNTNNWAGSNVPDNTNEYAVFSVTGAGSVDLQEFSYSIGSLTFLYGGYNIVDPNETPGTLTMGSMTNMAGTNTVNVGVTLSGDAVVKAGTLVLADTADFNANRILLLGGNLTVQGPQTMSTGKLNLFGYQINNEPLHNLNGNGGLFLEIPYAGVFLTTGPGNRGLNFDSDADFINAGAVSVSDYYMTMFEGYFIAPETGNYEFKINHEDDRGSIWLDLDRDGVFEAPGGYNTGENLAWEDWGAKTVALSSGQAYRFAATHQEWGGGSGLDISFKTPSMGSHVTIKPGDPTQSAYWAVGEFGSDTTTMTVPVASATNATLKVVSDTAVNLAELSVAAGSTLTIVSEGSSPVVSFTDAAVTGNVTVSSGDVILSNFTQSANSVMTIETAGILTVDSSLNLNTVIARGVVSAPGTITASTKMSFEPTRTITNVLAGGAAVYYGENRAVNGIITATGANTYSGGTWIRRTILRAASGGGLPAAGCLRFWSGNGNGEDALLETSGTFTRNIGTGSGEVYWEGSGGFSALGGPLDVTLEGGATLNFGDGNTGFRGQYLQLNSDNSDNVVDLKNNINLTTGDKNIYIRDNTATKTDMAILSGTISSGASSGNWIYRRGAGLLCLTGTNTFQHRLFFEDCGPIRADEGVGIPTTCMIRFDQNNTGIPAVWETKGTINRNLNNDGVASALRWNTAGGFSAYGGKLTVILNGGATIDWGASPTGFNNQWLLFGSPYSDNEVEMTNHINLTTGDRNVGVFDNPDTNTDVTVLSGVISGTGSTVWFRKQRNGTLWLKGANTFQQRILLEDGVIRGDDGVGISPNCFFRMDQGSWETPGIWEAKGSITRNIDVDGTAGALRWNENGGFSAYGGPLTVNLAGGATLDAGANPGLNGRQLQLGSRTANDVVDFQNGIWLNNRTIQIRVFDNPYSPNDYAVMSGDFSYTGWGDVEMKGEGLVRMTGSNVVRNLRLYDSVQVMINGYHDGRDNVYTVENYSGTIGGTGTLSAVYWMDIRNGGTLAPGDDGVGTLNITVNYPGINNGFDLWDGAFYECELGGVTNDRVALTGDLKLNDTWTLKLLDAGASPVAADQFDIFNYSGTLYSSMSGSNVGSVVVDCSNLPSHYVTNSVEVIHDIVGKRIYVTGLSSTLSIGNEEATGVTDTNAVLNGTLSCTGQTFDVYAYWGETDAGQTTNGWSNVVWVAQYTDVTGQALTHPTDSNLTGNTEYYYTFRASNDTYDIWAGASETFITLGIPVVTNAGGAVGIIAGNAKLKGGFLDHNRGEVTICWGLTDQGTSNIALWDHSEVLGLQAGVSFDKTVSEVYYPLTYYYRCFATNEYGFGWSAPVSVFSITNVPSILAPPDGLLGQWTFDDDTCDDISGNGYDGEMVGGSYDAVDVAVAGGQSINLTGGDYYVKVDTGGSQDVFDLDELSVSFWVKGWPDGSWEPMIAKQGENAGWQVRKWENSGDTLVWTLRDPGNYNWSAISNINDSAWHHVVATYGGGKRRLYVDNIKIGEEDRSGTINNTTDMLTFGARHWNAAFGYYSRIRLDDVCIYNRAIEAEDVDILFNSTAELLVGITNTAVSDVTTTSAQFNATLMVSNAAYQVYGYWGTNNGGTNIAAWSNSVDLGFYTNYVGGINYYTTNDINTTTTNYYTFRATNALDNIWAAPSWSFHTVIVPTVDNGSGAVTTAVGVATLRGALTAGNYANVYIYWGTNDGVEVKGDWSGVVSMGGKFDGTFETNVPVGHGVTYYYRCYATNAAGENWAGSTETFIMSVPPVLPPLMITNGLNYHLMADSLGYADGNGVAQWDDVSGNARHFTNGVGASQPLFKTGFINGLPAVSFDGTDDRATLSSATTNEMVFIVNRVIEAADGDGIWGSDNPGDRGIRVKSASTWQGTNGNANDFAYSTVADGACYVNGMPTVSYGATNVWHILMQQRGSTHSQVYNTTHIGWYYNARVFQGDIAEVLVYNRVLSTNEHNLVGNYLAQKYGLTSSYPVEHYLHLTNDAPTSILETEAVFNATLNGDGRVFHVYVYWDEIDGGNDVGAWAGGSAYVGAFTNLDGAVSYNATTDLTGGTAYYYNFRATNDFTNLWGGASVAFATLGAPAVSNAAATGVTSSSATLNGVLTAGGSADARIYWGTNNPGVGYTGWDYTNDFGTVLEGAFSTNVTVLAGGTYYYCVYATNSTLGQEAWPAGVTNFTVPQAAVSLSLTATGLLPTNIPGCVLWLDASDIDGDSDTGDNPPNGSPIMSWGDRSGSGHHANQSRGTPHYVTAGPNSKPVVHFTAADMEYLYTTYNFDALSKYSILAVERYTGGANGRVISSKTRNWLFGYNGVEDRFYAEGWIYQGNVPASTNWRLYAGTINDDINPLGAFWAEGVRLVTGNGGSSDTLYKPGQLGMGGYLLGNSEFSNCEVAEVIMFNRILSPEEINMLGSYLTQKYGLSTSCISVDLTETNTLQTITATLSAPAISNVTVNIKFSTTRPAALYHWGYNINNGALDSLENNGGLLTTVPYARIYLTDGPGGNGLYFASDAEWTNSGAVSQTDNFMNLIHGYMHVQNTGSHEFKIDWEDDIGTMWLDMDMDGIFEHNGACGDEQIIYDGNHMTVPYDLTAGNGYRFAVTHREGGGSSGIRAWVKTPTMGAQARIKPTEAQQANLWSYLSLFGTQDVDYELSSTSIVITAGSLTGSVTLTPIDDALQDDDESVVIDILSIVNATSGSPSSVTAIICSDDPMINNSAGASNVTWNSAYLNGMLSMGDSAWVTIYYGTNDGVTTQGNWNGSVSMGRLAEDVPFSASITGLLANTKYYYRCYATNESLLGEDWADVTTNFTTLGPSVSIGDRALVVERDVGTVGLILTVTMSETNSSAVSVNFTTVAGTAVAGTDYLGTNGTLTIPAGQISGQIVVRVINDTVFSPPPRTFDVVLSNPIGCTIIDARARVTILDNDAAAYLTDWQYSMKITFTNAGEDTLINWPALVRFSTNITGFSYSKFASVTGGDLRFSTGDGKSVLVYSIENWNTNGESDVWVQVPQLPAGGTNIWVYWGNTAGTVAPSYTTDSSTWDVTHRGVWHFYADATDATENNFDGTISGGTALAAGVTYNAFDFQNAADDLISIPRPVEDDFSIEFWMQADGGGRSGGNWWDGYGLVDADVSGTANDFGVSYVYYNGVNQPCFGTGGTAPTTLLSGTAVNGGGWHHVAVTRRKSTGQKYIYVDGVVRAAGTGSTESLISPPSLRFGKLATPANQFDGRLDEIRISDTIRSASWISASYTNQMPGSTANIIGTVRGKPLIVTTNGATNVTASAAYLTATLTSTGAAPAAVWLCWGDNDGGQVESQWDTVTLMGAVTAVPTNYNVQLTTLSGGTAYYYAYMASNSYGKDWAATNFYTIGKPFVENSAGAIEGSVSATLQGNLVSTGGTVTTVYTYWGDNNGGTNKTSWDYVITNGVLTEGSFSSNTASILVYGRQYYYRCYATNSSGGNWAATTELFLSTNPRVNDGSRMKISFPGYVGPTLTNIPMLVVLGEDKPGFTYDGFISAVGNDLRFWNSTETVELNYEIERWGTNYNFEPTDLSGCSLWLDAWDIDGFDDGTAGDPGDGQSVTVWKDKSPVGNFARLAIGAPTVVANGINSGPVVRFATVADMDLDSPVVAQGSTIFVMYKKNGYIDGDWQEMMDRSSGGQLHMKRNNTAYYGNTERVLDWDGAGLDIYSGISASEWHSQVMQLVAGTNKLWIDEKLYGPDASGNTFGDFVDIGNMAMDLAEVIVYNRTLTDDERRKVGGYLAGKYDLDGGYTPNDESYVWVQIPQLVSSNTYIWATWGDTNRVAKPAYTTNGSTWREDYLAVYHLNGTPNDSSSNAYDGVFEGNMYDIGGLAGGGVEVWSGGHVDLDDLDRWDSIDSAHKHTFTFSAWVNPDSITVDQAVLGRFGGQVLLWLDKDSLANYVLYDVDGGRTPEDSGIQAKLREWQYIVATGDGSTMRVYVDGVLSGTNYGYSLGPSTDKFSLGTDHGDTTSRPLDGTMDEARIADACFSSSWIWACWMNMASNDVFNVYSNAVDARVIENRPASHVQDIRAQFNGVLYAKSATYDVYVYWGQTDGGTNFSAWPSNAFVGNYTYVSSNNVSYTALGYQRLIPETNYFYTYFATNIAGGYWAYPSIALTTEPPYPSLFKIF